MQTPTNAEIQREIDSIRSMRRISSQSGPGSLTLDPDLPPQSPSGSSPGSSGGLSPNSAYSALPGATDDEPIVPREAGGFFWVPASLHPELAPSEFKAFLRDHKRDIEEGGDDAESSATGLSRMSSGRLNRSASGLSRSSSGLGRKKSMLSRQYRPKEGDSADLEEEDEEIKPIKRNRSIYVNEAPQLTIKDLQKLDDLADAAAAGNNLETEVIRRQLRRSMSMGYNGNIIDQIDAIQEDEENAPVIVPAKALQRTARTRIRKPGLEGDGNGHRFASTRRGKRSKTMDVGGSFDDGRPMSDMTSSDRTSLSDQEGEPYTRPSAPSPEEETPQPRFAEPEQRPVSIGESIYDAYGGDARDSTYYDARESLSQGSHRGGASGDYANLTKEPAKRGEVIYDTAEDEPFFTAPHTATASLPNVAITSETRDTRGSSAPTVVLRSRSPDREQEQTPLGRQSSDRKAKPPDSIEMPQNQYNSRLRDQQQHYQSPSPQSQYSNYPQPLPPSQQMYQSSQQQYDDGLHHPTPKRHLDVPNTAQPGVSPPSSPELVRSPSVSPSGDVTRPFSAPPTSTGRPSSAGKEKEKAKGRGWFGLGGGKDKADKEKEKQKEKEKEKDREREMLKKKKEEKKTPKEEKEAGGGLFGIFGSKKAKQDGESQPNGNVNANSMSGRNATNKQLTPFATVSPAVAGQYARYPLHVERAIYRLSHIKLANPRRPLYEQVLISNLMFWYLGIINKPVVPPGQQQQGQLPTNSQGQDQQGQPQAQAGPPPGAMTTSMSPAQQAAAAQAAAAEKARLEQEQLEREKEAREQEEREREMREIQEQEMREREQRERLERERLEKEREKPPRKSLNKADGRSRKADMPVKSPNYDAQSRTMDQERANGRPNTSPAGPGTGAGNGHGQSGHTSYHLPQRIQHQQQQPQRGNQPPQQPYFYQQDMSQVGYQPMNPYALPPGAKPPAQVENTWAASSTNDGGRSASKSPPQPQQYYSSTAQTGSSGSNDPRPRPSRSPPPHDYLTSGIPPTGSNPTMPNGARPGRSLSANAVNKKSSGPAQSESYPPTSSSRQADYDRVERPSHQYSQSASANISNGAPTSPPGASGSTGKLLKKKSTTNVQPSSVAPSDGTKPIPRRRKSIETGAADRRGVVEPEVPFESMWAQGYGQQAGYAQQAQQQGWGPYH